MSYSRSETDAGSQVVIIGRNARGWTRSLYSWKCGANQQTQSRIEVGKRVIADCVRSENIVAQTEIERQPAGCAPVILRITGVLPGSNLGGTRLNPRCAVVACPVKRSAREFPVKMPSNVMSPRSWELWTLRAWRRIRPAPNLKLCVFLGPGDSARCIGRYSRCAAAEHTHRHPANCIRC